MVTFRIIDVLVMTALTSLAASTFILVLFKYKVFERYTHNRRKWMPYICYLCVTFWTCVVSALILNKLLVSGLPYLDLGIVAFGATALARKVTADVPAA